MTDDKFTDPDTTHDEWVDVRMQDPEEGEWDIDAVVAGGQVEYVDLRIRPDLLTAFIDCLIADVGDRRAGRILSRAADNNGLTIPNEADVVADDDS